MRSFVKDHFTNQYSDIEIAEFLEAFINSRCLLKKARICEDTYLFLIEVKKGCSYCVIIEQNKKLSLKGFKSLNIAENLYYAVLKCDPIFL